MNDIEGTIEGLDEETLNELKKNAIEGISNEEITETQNTNEDIQELDKSIQKPKKPRTEKQKEALKKAQETRRKNLALKKQQKEEMKQAIKDNENIEPPSVAPEEIQPVRRPRASRSKKPVVVYEDDYSSEEEVIVVKRKPRRKARRKPKKKIVYEDPSSSSSEEEVMKKPSKKLQKSKKVVESSSESSDEESDYGYEKEYSYPVNRPLKYSDVFRFQ